MYKTVVVGLLPYLLFSLLLYYWPFVALGLTFAWAIPTLFPWIVIPFLPTHGTCPTPDAHQVPFQGVAAYKLVTFFYPGLGGSWMQSLSYVGKKGLQSLLVGDKMLAHIPNAPHLLERVYPLNPPEVLTSFLPSLFWFYTTTLTNMSRTWHNVLRGEDYVLDLSRVSFAQRDDIVHCVNTIRRDLVRYEDIQVVLAGTSRGAATVLGAVVHLTPEEQARIAFVLLEGVFDSVPSVCRARYGEWGGRLVPWLLSWVTRYDPTFESPLDMARRFPANVPVAVVTSRVDTHVPMLNTLAVRDKICGARSTNKDQVHLLTLENSHHSFYATDNLQDQTSYRALMEEMHRLYVKPGQ